MPAYNCEKYINKAIDSILNQTYKNFELLIADDYSTDKTKAIIDSYRDDRIKRFHNDNNLGYLKTTNKLFELCSGDFITFQDADDFSDKNRIERLINYLIEHPEIDCLGSNIAKVDINGNEFFKSNFPLNQADILTEFQKNRVVMTGSSLMIRKKVLNKIGAYNEYFDRLGSEDVYWYSLIIENLSAANLPDILYCYRANPNSVGGTFKDPRSKVLHNLTVRLFKERIKGQDDPIKNGNFKLADDHCKFLLLIEDAKKNKLASFFKSINMFIFNWNLFRLYSKDFYYALFKL